MILVNKRTDVKYLAALFVVFAILISTSVSCQEKIKVKTGSLRVCKYGEVLEDKTKTIKVAKNKAGDYKVSKTIELCGKHKAIEGLYREALESSASGDEKEARKAIEEAAKKDPSLKTVLSETDTKKQLNKMSDTLRHQAQEGAKAISQLAAAQATVSSTAGGQSANNASATQGASNSSSQGGATSSGSTDLNTSQGSSQDNSTDNSTNSSSQDQMLTNPRELIPASVLGYDTGNMNWGDKWANRDYTPPRGINVESLLIEVLISESKADAASRVSDVQPKLYPGNGCIVTINGNKGYFGTNDTSYVSVSFSKGNAFINVIMLASDGNPLSLKEEVLSVASQIP